jgi:hypothetical protein
MSSKHLTAGAAFLAVAALAACTAGGGSSGSTPSVAKTSPSPTPTPTPQPQSAQFAVSAGATQINKDATLNDPSTPGDRTRLGFSTVDQSFTLTTPAQTPVHFSTSVIAPTPHGHVTVRAAISGGTAQATSDFELAGLQPSSGNVVDAGKWIESHGDGFARLSFAGSITSATTLIVQNDDGVSHVNQSVVNLVIGARSQIDVDVTPITSGSVLTTTPVFSSNSPMFGLPAIAGNGDKVSVIFYDSDMSSNATNTYVSGVTRTQKRLQLATTTQAVTMGGSVAEGQDLCNWRDTQTDGLYNVIAIAQAAGTNGISVDLSFDRGATFAQSLTVGSGAGSHLVRARMNDDYTTAILYWNSDTNGGEDLVLAEGQPSAYDANGSPTAFSFGASQTLQTFNNQGGQEPLISDIQYVGSDTFVAYGCVLFDGQPNPQTGSTIHTEVGCLHRASGGTAFTKAVVDDYTGAVPYDPSLAVTQQGAATLVYVAYETWDSVHIRMSADGGTTFPTQTTFGSKSAYAPRIFVRAPVTGLAQIDCLYLDDDASNPLAAGTGLFLFHGSADLSSGAVSELVAPKPATQNGQPSVEGVSWFGYDATVLNGKLFAAVATSVGGSYLMGGGPVKGGPTGALPMSAAAAPPPLAPGMTGPAPAFDPNATSKLYVIEVD